LSGTKENDMYIDITIALACIYGGLATALALHYREQYKRAVDSGKMLTYMMHKVANKEVEIVVDSDGDLAARPINKEKEVTV
jgi:hypothetical protein